MGRWQKARQIITMQMNLSLLMIAVPLLLIVLLVGRLQFQVLQTYSQTGTTEPLSQISSVVGEMNGSMIRNETAIELARWQMEAERRAAARMRMLDDLPRCAAAGRARTFMLVFQGHSGSTALITSLRQHSQVEVPGLEPIDHAPFVDIKTGSIAPNGTDAALAYVHSVFHNATHAHNRTAGFKVRPTHLLKQPGNFSTLIRDYSTRIIWSYRSNLIKQAVGDYRIHHYKDKLSYEGFLVDASGVAKRPSDRPNSIRIDNTARLRELVKSRARADRILTGAISKIAVDGCVLPVSYESYLREPDATLERIQRFLGLDTAERHPSQRAKANHDSLCDLIENFDDVCKAFFGCSQLRWMLDDIENGCSCPQMISASLRVGQKDCDIFIR